MHTMAHRVRFDRKVLFILIVTLMTLGRTADDARGAQDTGASDPMTQNRETHESPPADSAAPPDESTTSPLSFSSGAYGYGLWVLAPGIGVLILTVMFRRLLPAMFLGLLACGYMLALGEMRPSGSDAAPTAQRADLRPYAHLSPSVGGLRYTAEELILKPLVSPENNYAHTKLVILVLVLGYAVGVIARGGGTAGLARLLAGEDTAPRRGMLTAWLGCALFAYDRDSGELIVGSAARTTFDRLKLSRAKLAAILDMTTFPAASLLAVGTWIAAEISLVQTALSEIPRADLPTVLSEMNGASAVVGSLPYRFYAIFAAAMMLWTSLLRREFGPMRSAESRALSNSGSAMIEAQIIYEHHSVTPRWWLGFFPLLTLAFGAPWLVVRGGFDTEAWNNAATPWWSRVAHIVEQGDPLTALYYAAILCAVMATVLAFASRACTLKEAVDAGLEGMGRMTPTLALLIMAWGMALAGDRLGVASVLVDVLQHPLGVDLSHIAPMWMPTVLFAATAGVAFLTGSPWLSVVLLIPVATGVMGRMYALSAVGGIMLEPSLFYAGVAAVATGAIFGGHCSPIGDSTIFASLAAGCRHEEHVWTQLPYALLAAVVTIGGGYVLCNIYGQPWHYALAAGVAALFLLTLLIGRPPRPAPLPTPAPVPTPPTTSTWSARNAPGHRDRDSGRP